MKSNLLILRQIDRQVSGMGAQSQSFARPREGWIRTIRKAFGMTIKQFAGRLGVNPSRVVKIETSEVSGALTLKTIEDVAEALDCHFVYAFVPKTSLEEIIRTKAKKIATEQITRTSKTMDLEDQSVEKKWLEEQIKELAEDLIRKNWKHLWE